MNNKKIIYVLVFFSALFLSLAVYLTTVGVYKKSEYAKKDLGRSLKRETTVLRGDIYDKNGEKLAYTKIEKNKATRVYPYKNLYSHLIGYYTEKRGSSLLENRYTNALNSASVSDDVVKIASFLNNKKLKAAICTLPLTTDCKSGAVKFSHLTKRVQLSFQIPKREKFMQWCPSPTLTRMKTIFIKIGIKCQQMISFFRFSHAQRKGSMPPALHIKL